MDYAGDFTQHQSYIDPVQAYANRNSLPPPVDENDDDEDEWDDGSSATTTATIQVGKFYYTRITTVFLQFLSSLLWSCSLKCDIPLRGTVQYCYKCYYQQ